MKTSNRYASSTDVARLAGVSQSAVSRTYKPGGSVSPETREKVLEAAERLGYRPSFIPSIMLNRRSQFVGVVAGGLYNPFHARILEALTSRLQGAGLQVLLVHADSGHLFDDIIPQLAGYRVDAIISGLETQSSEGTDLLGKLRVPVILLNTPASGRWIGSVSADNREAGRMMARHLIDRGAQRFAYLSGPMDSWASGERGKGFDEVVADAGYAPPARESGDFRYETGYAAALRLHARADVPEALFCANDLMALGAMDALRSKGLRIPGDVLVGGFDGIPSAAWDSCQLTTMAQDCDRMADEVLTMLLASLQTSPADQSRGIVVPARLTVRHSTAGAFARDRQAEDQN